MASKLFTREEVSKHNSRTETVFVIHNVVYDVSKFLDEHPGGHEVLVNVGGKDASEDFDDIGHGLDAKEMMVKYAIGEIVEHERTELRTRAVSWEQSKADTENSFVSSWKFPVLLGVLATILYSYVFG